MNLVDRRSGGPNIRVGGHESKTRSKRKTGLKKPEEKKMIPDRREREYTSGEHKGIKQKYINNSLSGEERASRGHHTKARRHVASVAYNKERGRLSR